MLFPTQSDSIARIRYGEDECPTAKVFESIGHDLALISEFAILCAEIYYRYANEAIPDEPEIPKKKDTWSLETFPMPALPGKIWHVGGLGMEVWTKPYQNKTVAVLIFRGTRGLTAQQDWFANCRWLTKYIPFTWDQYDETHYFAKYIVNCLQNLYPDNLEIYAAGHSLGGGLAQHAGYSVQEIKNIYAFNTSPITGFYSIPKDQRDISVKDMRILRIYEHGEILAYFRYAMEIFYRTTYKNPSIIQVRFNFDKLTNVIEQHNMYKLARGLSDML